MASSLWDTRTTSCWGNSQHRLCQTVCFWLSKRASSLIGSDSLFSVSRSSPWQSLLECFFHWKTSDSSIFEFSSPGVVFAWVFILVVASRSHISSFTPNLYDASICHCGRSWLDPWTDKFDTKDRVVYSLVFQESDSKVIPYVFSSCLSILTVNSSLSWWGEILVALSCSRISCWRIQSVFFVWLLSPKITCFGSSNWK